MIVEELAPEEHLLRKIDQYIDFSFIPERVRAYSEDNGRPSLDPHVLFKMMFIGYFYGIRSERELERQNENNAARAHKKVTVYLLDCNFFVSVTFE